MRYIGLLRGVNVGGRIVKMDDLRSSLATLNLQNIQTYIQSGNVFFDSDEEEEILAQTIEGYLEDRLGFAIPVCLRTIEEFTTTLENAPYKNGEPAEDERFCIVFTRQKLPDLVTAQTAPKNDLELLAVTQREAFVRWKIINGRPPSSSSNSWLEKLLGSPGTSRFYHTCWKILEAAKK